MQVFNVGYISYTPATGENTSAGYFLDLQHVTIDEVCAKT